jgi:predicted nucleic acid-binding protein
VTPVLLDTGCIVALLDRSERNHQRCAEVVEELSAPLVTCEPVIAEACWLLRDIDGAADAVLENVETGMFEVPFRLASRARAVRALMKKYRRVPMDLADACLVDLAEELDSGRILTLDSDFEIYRWRKNRAFELLLDDWPA